MQRHARSFECIILAVCFMVLAAFSFGCNERRSEGQKPAAATVEKDSKFQKNADGSMQVDGYNHVAQNQRFQGGIEPDDYKAKKLVNQLFNYCVGICASNQECPADLDAARNAIKEQYKITWPKDPWGKLYQYKKIDDMHCDVWSSGRDGEDGTKDDIHVASDNKDDLP